jgi:outer membrane lipoprotein-sorting protein
MSGLWRDTKQLHVFKRMGSFVGIVLALVLFAGCGNASAQTAATQILARIEKSNISDVTLDITIATTAQGKSVTGSGPMKFTQNPARFDTTLTIVTSGTSATVEEIGDIAGGVVYAKAMSPQVSPMWTKTDVGGSFFSYQQVFAWDSLSDAQLVGTETLDGAPVYHLRGDLIGGNVNSTCDLYVGKDTYRPVKTVTVDTSPDTSKVTMRYTQFNTGFSINLPPSDQVQYN